MPLFAACSNQPFVTQPSAAAAPSATVIFLEGEAGSGDGQVRERSRASGGWTVHLGPGEHRLWTFGIRAAQAPYAAAVTYSNGKEGPNEIIHVVVDGTPVSSFQDRDSGDSVDGWNLFVTDPAGASTLGPGSHTLTLEVMGGDGCVEIDMVTLSP
jgi:hypothetical protein